MYRPTIKGLFFKIAVHQTCEPSGVRKQFRMTTEDKLSRLVLRFHAEAKITCKKAIKDTFQSRLPLEEVRTVNADLSLPHQNLQTVAMSATHLQAVDN